MTSRFFEIRTPRVEAMPAYEKTVNAWVGIEQSHGFGRKHAHVLRIVEDGNPLSMIVGLDSFKSLEHFVAFYPQTALSPMTIGENCRPDRVRV